MRVAVDTDEVHGVSVPRRFRLDVREIKVVEILDQWFTCPGGQSADQSKIDSAIILLAAKGSIARLNGGAVLTE